MEVDVRMFCRDCAHFSYRKEDLCSQVRLRCDKGHLLTFGVVRKGFPALVYNNEVVRADKGVCGDFFYFD
jgi:hypothetical protein